ncbi:Lipopolysaccharide biosynthesis protein wzxC [Serratia entomophila]|uniref:lipopolysaccharide biosynthesis protein n=1 Tax=Serratia entomophila TaxID=42906 RepID=UPI00217B552E|nr:lipopolysaccharide biosynthesis protein [Serratia entomophila]CAI0759109.1 Lipopolysaccharide biosynthesis protein wzxC [Serratia entomophila]CAI1214247.1 Lipopolysaccharide biosynthesis protein wzxC [Serratia entomophila]CAI1950660.1 Lipopolysaccharide biosynthesis protein wzxC [Serratia entomophila]CAI2152377.1 Lipopolysaccharide biosynthesis protein wzxC [Serratia entomophila]CAI2923718.1 Lipopolysaccharide biosynthesis protein wzxC [Serratia entomophila]
MGLVSNAKWVAFSQLFKIGVQVLNIVVLARLIPPSEYGLMSMALVVTNFALLVRDLGTAAAIIQRKELQNETINAIFWLNILMGLAIAGVIVIFSPLISYLFHEPRLIFVLCLLAVSFPLASSASAHMALLERESKFKKVASIEISSSVVAVIIAITMAYQGFGVYSLVAQILILSLMSSIQLWLASKWRPSFEKIINLKEIKGLIGFSGNLTLFNFINYFSRNADSMMIGHYMSAAVLGFYSLAYRIMLFPLQSLTFVASRALFPILSQHQENNDKVRTTYLNVVYVILLIVFPLMTGLALLREPFIQLVFGPQWAMTATILMWLAPVGIIQAVLSTTGSVFMAKGRTDILMRLGILGAVLQVGAFIIGVRFDISTFAKLYFFANVINFFPVMAILMWLIGGTLKDVFFKIYRIAIATMIMGGGIVLLCNWVGRYHRIDNFVDLIVVAMLGTALYAVSMLLIDSTFRKAFMAISAKVSKRVGIV